MEKEKLINNYSLNGETSSIAPRLLDLMLCCIPVSICPEKKYVMEKKRYQSKRLLLTLSSDSENNERELNIGKKNTYRTSQKFSKEAHKLALAASKG
jgi:hypothetical protein